MNIPLSKEDNLWHLKRGDGKNPQKMSSQEKTPQEKTLQKVSCGENPSPYFGACGENPSSYFQACGETPSTFKKPSFWNFDIFYLNCIQTLTPPLYKKPSYWNFDIFI